MLGSMTAVEAVDIMASAQLDPDEGERADVRWALQMEAMHAFAGSSKPYPALFWLQSLPWRDEYVSPAERGRMEARHAELMAEFARNHARRKADG